MLTEGTLHGVLCEWSLPRSHGVSEGLRGSCTVEQYLMGSTNYALCKGSKGGSKYRGVGRETD